MKKLIAILIVVIALKANAQNLVYDANAEVRKVDAFNGVSAGGGITIYISQGKEQAVAVSAEDEKNVSKIKTEVKDGVLKIYIDAGMWNNWSWGNKKIKAYVTVTELNKLELNGGSVGKIIDELSAIKIDVECHGGSIVNGKITASQLSLDLTGGSIATLSGNFANADVEASGGSIVKDFDAVADVCKVDASGGSVINLTVNKELSADASGGSIINYKGNGIIKSVDTSGGSIIKKKE